MSQTCVKLTQIEALQDALFKAGVKSSIWQNRRIYLNGLGRDIKAYITFDDPTGDATSCTGDMGLFTGCALKVFSDCNQSRQWLVNRAKQVKHAIMSDLVEREIVPGPVCDRWQDVIL